MGGAVIIGVDPGHHAGAAVVIDRGGRFLALVAWKSGSKAAHWTVSTVDAHGRSVDERLTTYGAVAETVREVAAAHTCRVGAVEGLAFGAREGRDSRSIVVLAQAAGAVSAAVEQVTRVPAHRPLCQVWRRVLKLTPQTPGKMAKRAAIIAVGGSGKRRLMVRIPCQLPEAWREVDHAAEAACIAEWARRGKDAR